VTDEFQNKYNRSVRMKQPTSYPPILFLAATLMAGSGLLSVAGCASTETKSGTGEYIDDTVITTKVKAAILNDPDLKVSEINVETFKGVVQLSGFVSSQADIDRAVAVARDVGGVQSVKNDMRVK
jgi:osmotically-inducible protein OsmY